MTSRPYTDVHEIVKGEVVAHMKPFIEVMMSEHELTRQKMDKLEMCMKKRQATVNDVLQWVAIIALLVGMLIGCTGCMPA
jgi:cytosine/uracil/thiamine/allantoin permease